MTVLICLGCRVLNAQEIISAGGDCGKNSNGSVTFTVGEPISETFIGTTSILSQGFLQPDSALAWSIKDLSGLSYSITVIPNPAEDYILIEVKPLNNTILFYYLYDFEGKILFNEQIVNESTEISISHLVPSFYILKVTENRQIVKTLKIVKQL
jgi:hypothetical protein